jgi:hypothetical protein
MALSRGTYSGHFVSAQAKQHPVPELLGMDFSQFGERVCLRYHEHQSESLQFHLLRC